MKERVTVTIEQSLLKMVDSSVDGFQVKNRSHAIELLIERGMRYQLPARGIILAGGDIKKLLKPINGRAALQQNIDLLARYGINDIVLIVNKKDDRIKQVIGNGESNDVKISYVEEDEALGTAGALNLLRDELKEPFVLMNGDEIKEVNLREMYAYHKQQHGLCTIALTSVQDPSAYGVAIMNGSRIVGFIEKPQGKTLPSNLVNAGLYIVEPGALQYVPRGFAKLETDVFPKLAKDEKLIGYPFSGVYIDVQSGVTEKLTSMISSLNPFDNKGNI